MSSHPPAFFVSPSVRVGSNDIVLFQHMKQMGLFGPCGTTTSSRRVGLSIPRSHLQTLGSRLSPLAIAPATRQTCTRRIVQELRAH